MAEKHEKCPDCGTPLMDLERRLEVTGADASHRHHAVDCVVVLRASLRELADASEEAASSDPDMPSYKESGLRFDSALDAARALLDQKK